MKTVKLYVVESFPAVGGLLKVHRKTKSKLLSYIIWGFYLFLPSMKKRTVRVRIIDFDRPNENNVLIKG